MRKYRSLKTQNGIIPFERLPLFFRISVQRMVKEYEKPKPSIPMRVRNAVRDILGIPEPHRSHRQGRNHRNK